MAIKKISDATKRSIANKTALSLPNNPTNAGYSPEAIKRKLYAPLIDDTNSLSAEINRVIDEVNTEIDAVEVDVTASFATVLATTNVLEASKLKVDGSNASEGIKLRDTTFDAGLDTDAIKQVDLATYAEVGKTNLKAYVDSVQAQVDARITQEKATTDFYLKSDVDAGLALKSDKGHVHVEAEITDLDKYSQADADAKFMGKETYVDSNDKFLFSKLPDVAKQQTYVKATFAELPAVDVLAGSKGFITSTGDSYIYDGLAWVIMSDADWQNVSLEWANIVNPPVANGGVSLVGGTLYTKAQADALLLTKVDKNITAYTNLTAEENKTSARFYVDDNGTPKKMTLGEIYEGANTAVGAFVPNGVYDGLTAGYAKKSENGVDIDNKFVEIEAEIRNVGTETITYISGKVVSISSPTVNTTVSYGTNGDVIGVVETYADGKSYETTYTKDVEGRIKTMTKAEV